MTKTLIASAVVALVVTLLTAWVLSPSAPAPIKQAVERTKDDLGAAGPVFGHYISVGGTQIYGHQAVMGTASTTVCNIQSPAATSTLISASARFDVSTTTAVRVYIAKAASMSATTTLLGSADLAANIQGTVIATTTPLDALDEDKTFAPNQWLTVAMKGGVGTFSPTGSCNVLWYVN